MCAKDRQAVEADEKEFFAHYYEEGAYHPRGMELRLARELRWITRVLAGQRLASVLSIGCGAGQFELMLAPGVGRIRALDISPQAIEAARREAARQGVTNVDFQCQSLAELDWNQTFDAIVCLAFLHHVREAELFDFLQAIHAHLNPGGVFFAHDPNRHGWLRKVGRVVLGRKYDTYHSPDERELDPREIQALLRKAGFAEVRIGHLDSTLIPSMYLLAKGPAWPLSICVGVDWLWCHSPFARWASAFTTFARKGS